eukprot:3021477-Rhodomonas_salina.1
MIWLYLAGELEVLLGISKKDLQHRMLAAPKPSVDSGDGWQTVGKTTKLTRVQFQKIIMATGQTAGQLRVLALQVTDALITSIQNCETRKHLASSHDAQQKESGPGLKDAGRGCRRQSSSAQQHSKIQEE